MSRWSSSRAQTEPIAAIVAVMAIVSGIGIYAVYVGGSLPGLTDRSAEEPAIDRIEAELEDNGTYPAYEYGSDLEDRIDAEPLPYGRYVYVEITTVRDDGTETVVADGYFDTDGADARSEVAGDLDGPPDEAGVVEKPIAVSTTPGEVRGGTLRVGVWDP